MQKFSRFRTVDEIRALCQESGFGIDTSHFDNGADHITVSGKFSRNATSTVLYNSFNGRFFGYFASNTAKNEPDFNSDSEKYDSEPWFRALLNFFYVAEAGSGERGEVVEGGAAC